MKKQELIVEKRFSKKVTSKNKKAIDAYKSYKESIAQFEGAKYALGKKKFFKFHNRSTLNTNIDLNAITSTQSIQINSRLA